MRRVLAVVFLLLGIAGLAISVVGVGASRRVIDEIGSGLQSSLLLAVDGLETINDSLVLIKDTVDQVSKSMDTVNETLVNVSRTLGDTEPIIDQATEVLTVQVPDSIDAVQAALPNVAEAAGAIDDTLRILDSFEVDRQVFGIPIQFDLGISYDPEAPLDQTVVQLGAGLEGLPNELRALEESLVAANENLGTVSSNLATVSKDLDAVNENLEAVGPLIDDYLRLTTETGDLLRQTEANLAEKVDTIKLVLTILFVWIGINQIVPLYLAWDLFTGGEDDSKEQ